MFIVLYYIFEGGFLASPASPNGGVGVVFSSWFSVVVLLVDCSSCWFVCLRAVVSSSGVV